MSLFLAPFNQCRPVVWRDTTPYYRETGYKLIMKIGESLRLMHPMQNNRTNITFWSSDEDLATVSLDGVVTAVAAGHVQIVCDCINDPGGTATITGCRALAYIHVVPAESWMLRCSYNDYEVWDGSPWTFSGYITPRGIDYNYSTTQFRSRWWTAITETSFKSLELEITRTVTDPVNDLWLFQVTNTGDGINPPATWNEIGINSGNLASLVTLMVAHVDDMWETNVQTIPPFSAVTYNTSYSFDIENVDLSGIPADRSVGFYGVQLRVPDWDVVHFPVWFD